MAYTSTATATAIHKTSEDDNSIDEIKASAAAIAKPAVVQLLERISVTAPPRFPCDPSLEYRVKAVTETWSFGEHIHEQITTGIFITETSYAHLTIDAQVTVALYTILMTIIDDPEIFQASGAQDFSMMLCNGSAQRDQGPLGELARILTGMSQHFLSIGVNWIVSSTLRWLNGEMIANSAGPFFLEPRSKKFVDYHRSISGDSEAYAAFIWSHTVSPVDNSYIQVLQDACFYIDQANDILSYYKEELVGETNNYVHFRSRVMKKTPHETLCEVTSEVVAAAQRIRETLGEGPARDAWDIFEAGYIRFHFNDPRYRLKEVFGTGYIMDGAAAEAL